jgi:hypothetical protein
MKDILSRLRSLVAEVEAPGIELSEGQEAEVECARSGSFVDMGGTTVTFTPENLEQLAGTLPDESLLKLGHGEIQTDTPHYGNVTGLRYDADRDRLLAKIVPTPVMVRKNREEGFRRVSMELGGRAEGPWRFRDLAFLGARKPAVSHLAPVALAATAGEGVFVFAEGEGAGETELYFRMFDAKARKAAAKSGAALPDGSFPIQNAKDLENAIHDIGRANDPAAAKAHIKKRAAALGLTSKLPPDWSGANFPIDTPANVPRGSEGEDQMDEKIAKLEADLAAAKSEAEKEKAEKTRILSEFQGSVVEAVKTRLEGVKDRISLAMRATGLVSFLEKIAAAEVEDRTAHTFKFSAPDGEKTKDLESSVFDFVMALLASCPKVVTDAEGKEITASALAAENGPEPAQAEGLSRVVKFADSERHPQILAKLAELRGKDPKATYSQALEAWSTEIETAKAAARK